MITKFNSNTGLVNKIIFQYKFNIEKKATLLYSTQQFNR